MTRKNQSLKVYNLEKNQIPEWLALEKSILHSASESRGHDKIGGNERKGSEKASPSSILTNIGRLSHTPNLLDEVVKDSSPYTYEHPLQKR